MLETIKTLTALVNEHVDTPVTMKQVKRYLRLTATRIHIFSDDPSMWTPIAYCTLLDTTYSQYISDEFSERFDTINLVEMLDTLPYLPDETLSDPSPEVNAIMLVLAERFIFEIRVSNSLIDNDDKPAADHFPKVVDKETFNKHISDVVTKMKLAL